MLFEAFDKTSKQEWIDKATTDLKGASVLEKYEWALNDDIKLSPYYSAEDLNGLEYLEGYQLNPTVMAQADGTNRSWINKVNIIVRDEKTANGEAILALLNGADGLIFVIKNGNINLPLLLNDI
jgi:methylmalonyl-CoA mutase